MIMYICCVHICQGVTSDSYGGLAAAGDSVFLYDQLRPRIVHVAFDGRHLVVYDRHELASFDAEGEFRWPAQVGRFSLSAAGVRFVGPVEEEEMIFGVDSLDAGSRRVQLWRVQRPNPNHHELLWEPHLARAPARLPAGLVELAGCISARGRHAPTGRDIRTAWSFRMAEGRVDAERRCPQRRGHLAGARTADEALVRRRYPGPRWDQPGRPAPSGRRCRL